MFHARYPSAVFAVLSALALAPRLDAQEWTNYTGVSVNWSTASNWSGGTPTSGPTTALLFQYSIPNAPPTFPYATVGNYGTNNDAATAFTVNSMTFNSTGSGNSASNGVVVQSTVAGGGISFGGTNPAITQNGTGSVTFANGTATADVQLASNLTINGSGFGHVTIAGAVTGSGTGMSVNHIGSTSSAASRFSGGQIFISPGAANTFTGNLQLDSGNLTLNTTNAVMSAGSTLIINGGTVRGSSAFTLPNAVTLNSQLVQTGIIGATYNGIVSGNGGIRIASTGNVATTFTNTVSGTGAITVEGIGIALPSFVLQSQSGTIHGTALSAPSYTATLGTISLSNATANATRLNAAASMTLNNATFSLVGNSTAPTAESVASTTISGNVQYTLTPNSAQGLIFNAGPLTRTANATFQVTTTGTGLSLGGLPGANGNATLLFGGTITNINGILPYGFAISTIGGVDQGNLVRYDATNGVVPLNPATDYSLTPAYAIQSAIANVRSIGSTHATAGTMNSLHLVTTSAAAAGAGYQGNGVGPKPTLSLTSGVLSAGITGGTTGSTISSIVNANVTFGTTAYIQAQNTITITGAITAPNGLVKGGTGSLVLATDNPGIVGGLTVNAGNVIVSRDAQLGAPGGAVNLSIGQGSGFVSFNPLRELPPVTSQFLTVNRPTTIGGLGGGGLVSALNTTHMEWAGAISGTGRFFKLGAGVVTLSGTNTFTGDIAFQTANGILRATSDAALGDAANAIINNSAGAAVFFQPAPGYTSTSRTFMMTSPTISAGIFDGGEPFTLNGPIVGNQTGTAFLKSGSGSMTSTATNTINGPIQIGDATPTRRLTATTAMPGGTMTLNGANGSFSVATALNLNWATFILDNSANVSQNRIGSAPATLTGSEIRLIGNAGASVGEQLGLANATSVQSSTLANTFTVEQPNSGGANRNTLLLMTSFGEGTAVATAIFRGTNLGVTPGSSDTTTIRFTTTPTLTGSAGNQIIRSGVYSDSPTGIPQDFATHTTANGIERFSTYTALPTTGSVNTTTYNVTANTTLAGASPVNALKITDSTLDLAGNNLTPSGAGHILATGTTNSIVTTTGTPDVAFGSLPGRITTSGNLTIGSLANPVRLTGSGGLNKAGPGTLEVSSTTVSGPLNVSQGTYRLIGTQASSWTSGVTVSMGVGATLDINNLGTPAAPVGTMSLLGFGTVNIGSGAISTGSASNTFGGSLAGSGTLINGGTSTQTLNGNSPSFTGDVQVLAGILTIDNNVRPANPTNPGPLGTGTTAIQLGNTTGTSTAGLNLGPTVTEFNRNIVVPSGVPNTTAFSLRSTAGSISDVNGTITISRQLRLDNVTFSSTAVGYANINGIISDGTGAGSIDWFGGNFNIGGNNTFTGGTLINAASGLVLGLGHDNALGTGPIVIINGTFTGTLRADGGNRTIANAFDYQTGTTSNQIGFLGENNLTFTAANVSLLDGAAATTRTWVVNGPGLVTFNGNLTQTGGGNATLVKQGAGILVLGGTASNFGGGLTINQGTVRLANASGTSTGTGAVTINAGGRLEGTGTTASAMTVNANGIIGGGNGTSGTLNLGGNLTFAATTSYMAVGITDGSTAGAISTGTSTDAGSNPTRNTYINMTAGTVTGLNSVAPNISLTVDLNSVVFTNWNQPHSYRIAQGFGDQSSLNLTTASRFNFFNLSVGTVSIDTASLTGDAGGNVYLNFTPVPEPTLLLAVGTVALGLIIRRNRRA